MILRDFRPAVFQNEPLPIDTRLVGASALLYHFGISAPIRQPSAVSGRHIRGGETSQGLWRTFDKRYWPDETLGGHLTFAVKHERLDLLVIKRILEAIPLDDLLQWLRSKPTGIYARKIWFLYEFLIGKRLPLEDLEKTKFVEFLDADLYYTGASIESKRHYIRNNLLGTAAFCPMIRRTPQLEAHIAAKFDDRARNVIGRASRQLIARAAAFLLLADSQASFAIEGESPPRRRIERWGRAIMEAGRHPLSRIEIERLHSILIGDQRFIRLGLRQEGVFLGERTSDGDPLPEFIGARDQDLESLIDGLLAADQRMRDSALDPVLQAAATAFGFVYIHPLQDGNGRLHRYLLHHVLCERKFVPAGLVFPVSSVLLERIEAYKSVLQNHSTPLLSYIEWHTTANRNVEVANETADLYRYYDCTESVEFIYDCVQETIEKSLPREIDFLKRHDEAERRILERVEMPDQLAKKLIAFVRQNAGHLGIRRRNHEFERLTDQEVADLEEIVREAFEGFR